MPRLPNLDDYDGTLGDDDPADTPSARKYEVWDEMDEEEMTPSERLEAIRSGRLESE